MHSVNDAGEHGAIWITTTAQVAGPFNRIVALEKCWFTSLAGRFRTSGTIASLAIAEGTVVDDIWIETLQLASGTLMAFYARANEGY